MKHLILALIILGFAHLSQTETAARLDAVLRDGF
jgi:hypothetical protein